jgi:phenylpyruvate tautomerase PptA (4-oxalocrotonate tautomerase family)
MPSLQLDTPFSCSAKTKQHLAKRLGEIYAKKMNANINRISVAIRQLGEGGVWRYGDRHGTGSKALWRGRRQFTKPTRSITSRLSIEIGRGKSSSVCLVRVVKQTLAGW